jgi:Mrp family chromosome partitioning ATPase
MGKVRYVFASSNTSQGFHTFVPELIDGLDRVYILKGAAGTGKSTFIRLLGEAMYEQGYEVEFWVSALDGISPDGVYIPQLKAAVVNGSLPSPVDPGFPGSKAEIINLGAYIDKNVVNQQYQKIMQQAEEFRQHHGRAIDAIKGVARIKEEIKRTVARHLNMHKMSLLAEQITADIMKQQAPEKHYFASVVTAEGMINYLDEISSSCRKRYIFKGPPGSGKSNIIHEVAARIKQHGHWLEYYHSGIDAENIAMVIIPDLQLALIDAGDTEMAVKPGDLIVDVNICLDDGKIEYNDAKVSENVRNRETLLGTAQNELQEAEEAIKEIKKIYGAAMDFETVDKLRGRVQEELSQLNARNLYLDSEEECNTD